MDIKHLKMENVGYHDYFVKTTHKILSGLGMEYSLDEIDKMCIDNSYYLYFHNKQTKRWHLGIWAVGDWGIKESIDGKVIPCGYGIDSYKALTICVFLIHDWTYDKFRPTYSDWHTMIEYNEEIEDLIEDLRYNLSHSISSYYDIIDEDSYNFQHKEKNKYIAYFKAWYTHVFLSNLRKKYRTYNGYIFTKLLMLITHFDKRIFHREYKFHKDDWNEEYNVAIVFNYGKTEWDDWKRWNDYRKVEKFFDRWSDYNVDISMTYLDENGNIPFDKMWRGVYWEEEPIKE